jgi:hypothetical protein
MTLNYRMIVERHPKSSGVVDGLINDFEILTLLDQTTSKVATCLLHSPSKTKGECVCIEAPKRVGVECLGTCKRRRMKAWGG